MQHPMTTLEATKESESTSEITLEDTTPEKNEEESYPARPKVQREYKSVFGATTTNFLEDKIALMELRRAKYQQKRDSHLEHETFMLRNLTNLESVPLDATLFSQFNLNRRSEPAPIIDDDESFDNTKLQDLEV